MASKREVAKCLDSPEGQKWSRGKHNGVIKRGSDWEMGVFGEVKADDDAMPMDTKGALGWLRREGR